MSDRTWLEIRVKKCDIQYFKHYLDRPDESNWFSNKCSHEDDHTKTFYIKDCNYGCICQIEKFAQEGLIFIARNGSGKSYGPSCAVCYNGELIDIDANCEGIPIIPYNSEGFNKHILKIAIRYWELHKKIKEYFENGTH